MKKTPSSILLVVSLSCLVFLLGCKDASSVFNPNPPQPPTGPQAPAQVVLSGCGTTISSPGAYSLNSSLTTNADDEPCIAIANVNNVTLNCDGNSITGPGDYGISVINVNGLAIENCNVATGNGDASSMLLSLSHVNGGTVTGSTFGSNQGNLGGLWITDSTNVTFGSQLPSAPANPSVTAATNPSISGQISNAPPASNTVYGYLHCARNVALVIEGNALTAGSSSALNPFVIAIIGSQNSHVVNNTVNGLGNPTPIEENGVYYYNEIGTDDDILIEDETGPGSLVSGNLLVNTFDCGIETVGFMEFITIENNYIDTVFIGIGGWYYLSVRNAQFVQNAMTNIQYVGFGYWRIGGLRPAGAQNLPNFSYTTPAGMPAETTINFTQNQFIGNTLSQPIVFQGDEPGSVMALVYSRIGYATTSAFPGTDPTPQQFITRKNIFASNTFDSTFSQLAFSGDQPWTYTSDDVIDGKGNICSPSSTWAPSVSPTFGDLTGTLIWVTPINCGSGN